MTDFRFSNGTVGLIYGINAVMGDNKSYIVGVGIWSCDVSTSLCGCINPQRIISRNTEVKDLLKLSFFWPVTVL